MSKKEQFKILIREFHSQVLPETLARDLEVPLNPRKIITVYGPRRSGKSFYFFTLIQKLMKRGVDKERLLYINFEDDRILPLDSHNLSDFIEAYFELYPDHKAKEVFFFFDEIQNISGWEVFVRRIHDKEKAKIFLTGSSSKLLSKEIATSLRGRTISFSLSPLNFKEFMRFKGFEPGRNALFSPERYKIKKFVNEYLEYGGFPEVVLESNDVYRNKILEEYFESLVVRDLAERNKIENIPLLKDLLKYLFTNTASLFSVHSYFKAVKQSLKVSRQTIQDYLKHIQDTLYIHLLPKFAWSLKEQKVNPQKIISLDMGMRNRIIFRFTPDEGKAAENTVGSSLIRSGNPCFYWQGKKEVDFVVQKQGTFAAFNVTWGSQIKEREIESLLEFQKEFKEIKQLFLITKDEEGTKNSVTLIPLWKWLLI